MATRAANKRLVREYKAIQENPPPFIEAHPSENNILEWHYLLTGPPNTPYHNGQYWGTLVFPSDYPFKPPAIRMITPSGRFQTNTRLCLSISDFHPKSFNPAWEVSTILIGLLSFMTSEEMTTGSISASEQERKTLAARSRWWNSTGGGTCTDRSYADLKERGGWREGTGQGNVSQRNMRLSAGNIRMGDGGEKFREEFPDVDEANWRWMKERKVNIQNGVPGVIVQGDGKTKAKITSTASSSASKATTAAPHEERVVAAAAPIRRRHPMQQLQQLAPTHSQSTSAANAVVKGGESWLRRHKFLCAMVIVCGYVLLARLYE